MSLKIKLSLNSAFLTCNGKSPNYCADFRHIRTSHPGFKQGGLKSKQAAERRGMLTVAQKDKEEASNKGG